MAGDLLLGIDVGTTNIKALVFDASGACLSAASVATPTERPQPGWAEHDPQLLWQAVVGVIRRALAPIDDPRRVRGMAVASVGEAGVLVNALGEPVTSIIAWYDRRTAPYAQRWSAQDDVLETFRLTGMLPAPIYGIFKLQWLRDHEPEGYAAATTWLHVADYIAFRLCGARATDYSLASRSMLFDLRARCWSQALIDRAGLRGDLLPELVASGTRIGTVTAEAAAETGLAPGTVVGAGGHDHVCGALAADVRRVGDCLDSMGTAEAAFLPLDDVLLDERLFIANVSSWTHVTFGAHVARDRYYVMDGLFSSGAAVEWMRELAAPGAPLHEAAAEVESLAASAPPGSLGVLFLPRLTAGERGAFVGLTVSSGRAALARAVYEGLAFEWRHMLDNIEEMLGVRARTIRAIGGGTRLPVWLGIKAHVLGRPLRVLDMDESVALGAALLGGIAAGIYSSEDEAVSAVQVRERTVAPDEALHARYERIYREAFLRLAPALAPVHAALNELER
ncbi:MAG: FGGY family carbohydrate kinase [Roseiflexus sp.]|nr:FGGY family carbohydrate kinase [Roseiflexus sp.]MCS7290929.1 FGGY family carbohydrate kinase [Roseiflexus sp.]MDW8145333.1 FGGY-family carbohydrate kinase [Roseiflexaceae bacterium]MDW8234328.1 FGGY-family carbohydrate kinase [Roseiflexaceae bacterium]